MVSPETEELIRASVVADVWRSGEGMFWRRRAAAFEWAKPRPDDFHGQATREDLSAAWRRCHDVAEACRLRATVAETGPAA